MSAKVVFILCAQALVANVGFSQCIHAPPVSVSPCGLQNTNVLAYGEGFGLGSGLGIGTGLSFGAGIGNGLSGAGLNAVGILPTGGGGFAVRSIAPTPPKGIAVESENFYEGTLDVVGELPFLSTVDFEGVVPSAGVSVVNHGCGNGITAITGEIDNYVGIIGANGIGAGFGSGIIGAGGIGSGIIGANGIGSGAFGNGFGLGGISSGINGYNFGQTIGSGCNCGW